MHRGEGDPLKTSVYAAREWEEWHAVMMSDPTLPYADIPETAVMHIDGNGKHKQNWVLVSVGVTKRGDKNVRQSYNPLVWSLLPRGWNAEDTNCPLWAVHATRAKKRAGWAMGDGDGGYRSGITCFCFVFVDERVMVPDAF